MKAAVVSELGAPLEVHDVPVPSPGPGQILVKIEASGLCHTDIHAARGEWPVKPKIPLIPGHEGVGIVTKLGEGELPVADGVRVALLWLGHACGHCRHGVAGWETYCQQPQYMGYTIDGSYAEYTVAYASHVVKVPDGVDAFDAAALTCAGVTTYKGLKVAHPQPSETVMVVGIGGLGHLGLQYARAFGSTTVAVDVEEEKIQLAKELGADHVVDARGDLLESMTGIGGADVALVTVPSPSAMQTAHAALSPNGRMVIVGLPAHDRLELPIFDTVLTGKSVIGSLVGTRNDLADCFALHARGLTKVVAERRQLENVNDSSRRSWPAAFPPGSCSTCAESHGSGRPTRGDKGRQNDRRCASRLRSARGLLCARLTLAPSERIRAADGHQLKAKQLTADTDDIERDARTAEPSGPPAEN